MSHLLVSSDLYMDDTVCLYVAAIFYACLPIVTNIFLLILQCFLSKKLDCLVLTNDDLKL